jgi:hypothetical protein
VQDLKIGGLGYFDPLNTNMQSVGEEDVTFMLQRAKLVGMEMRLQER